MTYIISWVENGYKRSREYCSLHNANVFFAQLKTTSGITDISVVSTQTGTTHGVEK